MLLAARSEVRLRPSPGDSSGQPEQLVPVAAVGVERRGDGAVERGAPSAGPCTRRRLRSTWRRRSRITAGASWADAVRSGDATGLGSDAHELGAGAVREDGARRQRRSAGVGRSGSVSGGRVTAERPWPAARGRAAGAVRRPPLRQTAGARLLEVGAARVAGAARPRSGVAWRHTITKRCTAVNAVSTSMIHSTGTRMSNARPTPSSTSRSARSMSPPRAVKPSDSARARS